MPSYVVKALKGKNKGKLSLDILGIVNRWGRVRAREIRLNIIYLSKYLSNI